MSTTYCNKMNRECGALREMKYVVALLLMDKHGRGSRANTEEADLTSCSICNVYSLWRSPDLAKNVSPPLANVQDVVLMYWHLRKK